jgi:hypothetical protein
MGKNKKLNLNRKNKQVFKEIAKSVNTQIQKSGHIKDICVCNDPESDMDEFDVQFCLKCGKNIE